MSLRFKLLLLSLLTLVLPFAGCQYAQQMETTLRNGQEAALLTTAEVLGRVVASQPEELYRVPELRKHFDPQDGDLFAPHLFTESLIDGFADEWPVPTRPVPGGDLAAGGPRLGISGRYVHAYFEVSDSDVHFHTPGSEATTSATDFDRIIFLTRDEAGRERAWSVSAVAPGPIVVHTCEVGAPWRALADEMPYVSGIWRQTVTGYAVELRAPLSLFGVQLAVFALDNERAESGTHTLGAFHVGSQALQQRLRQYAPEGVRVSVVDTHGWLLARAGSVAVNPQPTYGGLQPDEEGFMRSIYRRVLKQHETRAYPYGVPYGMWGSPVDAARAGRKEAIWFEPSGGEPSLVRAAVPVLFQDEVIGALVVEQPSEQLALIRDAALTRLFNLTLLAMLFGIAVTLVFAARLSQRIRRLGRAAATALTPEGRLQPDFPETHAGDELGALARSYRTLLGRLQEYTSYLQTLGNKLSHELRTPLTIVSSSLENLASESSLPADGQQYLLRARDGAHRMQAILTAMTEATRVEQSIEHTERIDFDLAELVRNMGQTYRQSFSSHQVEVTVVATACYVNGAPDLIVQLLDKLLDNAAGFAPPGGRIDLTLTTEGHTCTLSVSNDGPPLPSQLDGRLFESLVSSRTGTQTRPHLGLGLYVVRLITDFHRGQVTAANKPDASGVIVAIMLPMLTRGY